MRAKTLGVGLVVCVAAAVHASSDSVTFNGLQHPSNATIISASGVTGSFYADTLIFNAAGPDVAAIWGSNPSANFDTVCGDLFHDITYPPAETYGATFVDSISFSGTSSSGASASGVQHAGSIVGYVGALAAGSGGAAGNLATLDNTEAAALQIAVWEALYDTDSPTGLTQANFFTDLTNGTFDVTTTSVLKTGSAYTTLFNDAYAYYTSGYGAGDNAVFIEAQHSGTKYQDQFALVPGGPGNRVSGTPEPFTMTLALAGIGLFFRRRSVRSS